MNGSFEEDGGRSLPSPRSARSRAFPVEHQEDRDGEDDGKLPLRGGAVRSGGAGDGGGPLPLPPLPETARGGIRDLRRLSERAAADDRGRGGAADLRIGRGERTPLLRDVRVEP